MFGLDRFRENSLLQWLVGGIGSLLLLGFIVWSVILYFNPDFRIFKPGPRDKIARVGWANVEVKDASGKTVTSALVELSFRKPHNKDWKLAEVKLITGEGYPEGVTPRAYVNSTIKAQVWQLNGGVVSEGECKGSEPTPQTITVTENLATWGDVLPKGTKFSVQFQFDPKTENPTAKKSVILTRL